MQHSENFTALAAALAKAQGDFPAIPRDRTVTVRMREKPGGQPGGTYTFRYAPLETILEKTRKPLAENGIALVQSIVLDDDGKGGAVEVVRTTMLHESGEWLACDVPMFVGTGDNRSQAYASGMTYSRRYGVTLLLCVAADEDDDGNGGDQDLDKARPDYERAERPQYRGSFPKGGRNTPQQDQQAPRQPQRRSAKPADAPADPDGEPDAHAQEDAGSGELYGSDLSGGQLSMLRAAALAGGFDDAAVLELVGGPITADTFKESHRKLKAAVNAQLAD